MPFYLTLEKSYTQKKIIALTAFLKATSSTVSFDTFPRSHVGFYNVELVSTGKYRLYTGYNADNVARFRSVIGLQLDYPLNGGDSSRFDLCPYITADNSNGDVPYVEFTCYTQVLSGTNSEPVVSFSPRNLIPGNIRSIPVTIYFQA